MIVISGLAWPFALVTQPLGNASQSGTVVDSTNAAIAALAKELHFPTTSFVGPTWLQGEGACQPGTRKCGEGVLTQVQRRLLMIDVATRSSCFLWRHKYTA
jgi:hypothetical protein